MFERIKQMLGGEPESQGWVAPQEVFDDVARASQAEDKEKAEKDEFERNRKYVEDRDKHNAVMASPEGAKLMTDLVDLKSRLETNLSYSRADSYPGEGVDNQKLHDQIDAKKAELVALGADISKL